jgi:hypothetical protein
VGNTSTTQAANPRAMYGSWIVHTLPYLEQQALYSTIQADVELYGNTGGVVTAPGGALISPAVPAVYDLTGLTYRAAVPATYNQWTAAGGKQEYVATTNGNGYTIYTLQYVPPLYPDPGTGTPAGYYHQNADGTWTGPISPPIITPAQPAVYGPPGPPVNGYVGIFNPATRASPIPILLCPSDPSPGTNKDAGFGLVYASNAAPWTSTNYLANWNAFTNGNATLGYTAPPQAFRAITDGLSNTVLLSEGYEWCEGRGRTALLAWHSGGGGFSLGGVHNFGLTYGLANDQIVIPGDNPVTVQNPNGFPNPSGNPELIFLYQIRPTTSNGPEGCNSLTAQSGHNVVNVALADGSVRGLGAGISLNTWRQAMLPRDGEPLGSDW